MPAVLGEALLARTAHAGQSDRILILLQLAGGNDGLNTVVPYANDHYYRARPKLGLRGKDIIRLNDELGLHSALRGMRELYEQGHLSIVQGVGYENPNRSHFKATEIWQTASDSTQVQKEGWLGRYLDLNCKECEVTAAVTIGQQVPQALFGRYPWGLCLDQDLNGEGPDLMDGMMSALEAESGAADGGENAGDSIGGLAGSGASNLSPLDFIAKTAQDATIGNTRVEAALGRSKLVGHYPPGALGHSMRKLAELIGGGFQARIYHVSQGGYDTHINQRPAHARLLGALDSSLRALMQDLKAQGNLDRVLLVTYSEFGRRLQENASGGTDHGATAPLFLLGGKVKGGVFGAAPNLAPEDLRLGDPVFTTDYRSVYASVLEQWLGVSSEPVLGRIFPQIGVI